MRAYPRASQRDLTAYHPFIYGLVDPDDIGHIRYVGMAPRRGNRPYEHAKAARKERTLVTYQVQWVRKLQAEGRDYLVTILEENPCGTTREALGLRETHWILKLREQGHRLTNLNDGGCGGFGGPHTEEACQNMKDGWTPEIRKRVGEASRKRLLGVPRTRESRVKQSETSRGHKKSEETKRAMAEARARAWAEGKYDSPEYHKKLSDAATASGHIVAIGHANLGKHHTDDVRAQMSASQYARVQREKEQGIVREVAPWSDERRARHSAILKAAWERRKAAGYTVPAESVAKLNRGRALAQIRKIEAQIRELEVEMITEQQPEEEHLMKAGEDPRIDQHKDRKDGGFIDPPSNSKTSPAPGGLGGGDAHDPAKEPAAQPDAPKPHAPKQ